MSKKGYEIEGYPGLVFKSRVLRSLFTYLSTQLSDKRSIRLLRDISSPPRTLRDPPFAEKIQQCSGFSIICLRDFAKFPEDLISHVHQKVLL